MTTWSSQSSQPVECLLIDPHVFIDECGYCQGLEVQSFTMTVCRQVWCIYWDFLGLDCWYFDRLTEV